MATYDAMVYRAAESRKSLLAEARALAQVAHSELPSPEPQRTKDTMMNGILEMEWCRDVMALARKALEERESNGEG